jgi:hypothetical protein
MNWVKEKIKNSCIIITCILCIKAFYSPLSAARADHNVALFLMYTSVFSSSDDYWLIRANNMIRGYIETTNWILACIRILDSVKEKMRW